MDVPAPPAGTVGEVLVKVGDEVSEGTPILLLTPGDGAISTPPSLVEQQEPAPAAAPASRSPRRSAHRGRAARGGAAIGTPRPGRTPGRRVRRMARELGVDLAAVTATGPKGRITKDDLLALPARAPPNPPPRPPPRRRARASRRSRRRTSPSSGPVETAALPRIKKVSGPFLHRSWLNVPHVTHNDEADITDLDALPQTTRHRGQEREGPLPGHAAGVPGQGRVAALKKFPEFNSSLSPEKDALILKQYYNIGIAVDTPGGLVVPVVKDADRKGIVELSREFMAISGQGPRRQARPVRHGRAARSPSPASAASAAPASPRSSTPPRSPSSASSARR